MVTVRPGPVAVLVLVFVAQATAKSAAAAAKTKSFKCLMAVGESLAVCGGCLNMVVGKRGEYNAGPRGCKDVVRQAIQRGSASSETIQSAMARFSSGVSFVLKDGIRSNRL